MKITVNRPVFKGFADQQNVRRIVFSQQNVPRRDFHTLFDKIYHNRVEDNLTQSVTNVGAGFFADQVACQLHSIHWEFRSTETPKTGRRKQAMRRNVSACAESGGCDRQALLSTKQAVLIGLQSSGAPAWIRTTNLTGFDLVQNRYKNFWIPNRQRIRSRL